MKKLLLTTTLAAMLFGAPAFGQNTDPLDSMKAEHIMVATNDYNETMAWYQDTLDFRIKHEWTVPEFPGLQLAYLEKNGYIVEIVASADTPDMDIPENFAERFSNPGIGHFAFLVEDVDAVAADLQAKNVSMPMPPTSFPDSGRRLIFIEDNNGNVIEFLEELPLSERKAYTGGEAVSDEKTIQDLTQKWLSGWNIGDQAFDAEVFRPLFSEGDIEVFDNVQGDVIVLRSVEGYIQTWKPFMEPLTHWSTKLEDLNIRISGDLAVTTFKLVGTDTRGPDGEHIPFGQYGTHVWENQGEHGWRIVHEHLTSYDAAQK